MFSELVQRMDAAKELILVFLVSGVVTGIVLGGIAALYRISARRSVADDFRDLAADQSLQSGMPTISAQEIDSTAPHSPQSSVPRANNLIRLVNLLGIVLLIAIAGVGFLSYYTSKRNLQSTRQPLPPAIERPSDFEETYKQLGIQPLPLTLERQQQIQSRLSQLSREACYTEAIVGLGRALLDAGYPREAAISSRSFVKRCGSATEVLPLAYNALQKLNDYPGALEVADELVNALPANATFRYWRALAYGHTGKSSEALLDYMNTVQLASDPKTVFGDVFYNWSRTYAALGRYCDAISPIEMYISLDPANRRTPQTTKVISDYAEQGKCDKRHATGTTRVPFAVRSGVRTLSVVVNNVPGTMILDTGATFVSITSGFAAKARVRTEPRNQVIIRTVGGKALADIGYANSISAGKAVAFGVTTAVMREDGDPFGKGVDGLLGMSFLSRFNVRLSPTEVEMTATPLR